jgi:hypothetical protein
MALISHALRKKLLLFLGPQNALFFVIFTPVMVVVAMPSL